MGHIGLNRQRVAHRRRLQINSRAALSARLNIYCQCVDRHGLRCYDSCMPRLLCHHFSRCVPGPSVVDMCTQGALGNPSWSLPSLCRCCEATNDSAPQASVSLYGFQSCNSVIMYCPSPQVCSKSVAQRKCYAIPSASNAPGAAGEDDGPNPQRYMCPFCKQCSHAGAHALCASAFP